MKANIIPVIAIFIGLGTVIWNCNYNESTNTLIESVSVETNSAGPLVSRNLDTAESGSQDPDLVVGNTTQFMDRKLDAAKNIVSGLALEDYEMISKNAQDLALLSLESQWKVFQTTEYIRLSDDFRESSKRLREAGRAENVDGSTLAYFEVTLNCVRCHKYIRNLPNE